MNSLNSVLLEGNVVAAPTQKKLGSGSVVTTFEIESARFYKREDTLVRETSTFRIEAWARLGQSCYETLTPGRGVRVVGRIKSVSFDTGKGMVRVTYIIAEHVEFKPTFKAPTEEVEAPYEDAGEETIAEES